MQDAVKRTKPLTLVAAIIVALVALLSACRGEDNAPNAPTMVEGSWKLETLNGAAADPAVPIDTVAQRGQGERQRRDEQLQRQLRRAQ